MSKQETIWSVCEGCGGRGVFVDVDCYGNENRSYCNDCDGSGETVKDVEAAV